MNEEGMFLGTTQVWDITEATSGIKSPVLRELFIRLYQNMNLVALAVNSKDTGIYNTSEYVCGQQYFSDPSLKSTSTTTPSPRQVYRKVIDFGELPNNTTKSVAHNINVTSSFIFTRIYGAATDQANLKYIPLPYSSSTTADIVELYVDNTNVYVKTGKDMTSYSKVYIVLEYLKF